jgi:hypothetical protein
LRDSLLVLTQVAERQAQVVQRLGIRRTQRQGGAATGGGLLVLAQGALRLGQVGVKGGDIGTQRDGALDELDGAGRVAALLVQNAEEMQHCRVVRIALQKRVVAAGGVGVAAGLVKRVSRFQVQRFQPAWGARGIGRAVALVVSVRIDDGGEHDGVPRVKDLGGATGVTIDRKDWRKYGTSSGKWTQDLKIFQKRLIWAARERRKSYARHG